MELIDGVLRTVNRPTLTFSHATRMATGRDLVLMLGIEPNLKWKAFCDDVVALARHDRFRDRRHARRAARRHAALAADPLHRLRDRRSARRAFGHGAVALREPDGHRRRAARRSTRARLPVGIDLGTSAPLRRVAPNPKATRAILDKLAGLLDLPLDLTDLDVASAARERSVADVVASDSEVTGYVSRLEARYDESLTGAFTAGEDEEDDEDDDDWLDEDDLPSGDSLAEDFERYLREHRED